MTLSRTHWLFLGAALLLALGLWRVDASPLRVWMGVEKLGWLVALMWPPSPGGVLGDLLRALAQTLAMAFLGTVLAAIRFGLLPQVAPVMLSFTLYTFESNTRSATILGVVGAGGIGLALADRIRINNWDEAAFIVLLILGTVAVIDTASRALRLRLIRA